MVYMCDFCHLCLEPPRFQHLVPHSRSSDSNTKGQPQYRQHELCLVERVAQNVKRSRRRHTASE